MATNNPNPPCIGCGAPTRLRVAKKSKYAGNKFYGCSTYPKCNAITPYEEHKVHKVEVEAPTITTLDDSSVEIPQPKRINVPRSVDYGFNLQEQSKLFQSVGAMEYVMQEISKPGVEDLEQCRRAFSQWRMDFPMPLEKVTISDKFKQIASIAESILARGSISMCSPGIEDTVINLLPMNKDEQTRISEVFRNIPLYPRSYIYPTTFDSDEENNLYDALFANESIRPWVFSQIDASSISAGNIDAQLKRRVDFYVCHPHHNPFVVEVDGIQHSKSVESDEKLDQQLQQAGVSVIRVPTEQVSEENGSKWKEITRRVKSMKLKSPSIGRIDNVLQNILLVKAATQLQLVGLEAIRGGYLDYSEDCVWKVRVGSPSWLEDNKAWLNIAQAALEDLAYMLAELHASYYDEEIRFQIEIVNIDQADVSVMFGDASDENNEPHFRISDIYLPFDIAFEATAAQAKYMVRPEESSVKFFLKWIFRKEDWRPGQWRAIRRILLGDDCMLILPTGGGKSIAFQLAAMLLPGICLIVDPLIALINDQCANLMSDYGIDRAVGITSQLLQDDKVKVQDKVANCSYLFTYITPERLQVTDFRNSMRAATALAPISLVVIDEAHCVSEWGHDFRTAYLNVARVLRQYCEKDKVLPALMACTGTASRAVANDMERELGIDAEQCLVTVEKFVRDELHYNVERCKSEEKLARLNGILNSLPSKFNLTKGTFFRPRNEDTNAGIVFYPHVNGQFGIMEGLSWMEENIGSQVGAYSGSAPKGIDYLKWDRRKVNTAYDFKKNIITILNCTTAFGMGIDKSNIRYSVHMNLPKSMEAFYQESGRAGRDGEDAQCFLVVSDDFPERSKRLLDSSTPLEEVIEIVEAVKWAEADDVSRQLWFHVNQFRGVQNELREVKEVVREIGTLDKERNIQLTYVAGRQNAKEKAIFRLVIVGVIKDYTVNRASEVFEISLTGNGSNENIDHFRNYVSNYDSNLADALAVNARERIGLFHNEFVVELIRMLITDFIYNVIEQGRRRSLLELLQACNSDDPSESFEKGLQAYMDTGMYTELLDDALQINTEKKVRKLIDRITSRVTTDKEARALRGETIRELEDNPLNPPLLMIRSLAETYCDDCDINVVADNFRDFVVRATDKKIWGMESDVVIGFAGVMINDVGKRDVELAEKLTVELWGSMGEGRDIARAIVKNVDRMYSDHAYGVLITGINEKLKELLL